MALTGAGLTVAGVASAKVVDGPGDSSVIPGTAYDNGSGDSSTPGVSVSVGLLGGGDGGDNGSGSATPSQSASGSASTSPSAVPSTSTSGSPSASGSASGSASASASASGSASSSASASPSGAGGAGGTGDGGVPVTQPPGRTQLAETGSSSSTPMILAGGLTFVLGGAVFRFGPRAASSRKH